MSKFQKNKGKEMPALSTASLPDIVFIMLFFFMVSTVLKEADLLVDIEKPTAEASIVLEKKELVDYIYAGVPVESLQGKFGSTPRIQLDDQIVSSPFDIRAFITAKRQNRAVEQRDFATTSIKADKDEVQMSLLDKIENELKEVEQLRINYASDLPRGK